MLLLLVLTEGFDRTNVGLLTDNVGFLAAELVAKSSFVLIRGIHPSDYEGGNDDYGDDGDGDCCVHFLLLFWFVCNSYCKSSDFLQIKMRKTTGPAKIRWF